jgi:hypothetical protein
VHEPKLVLKKVWIFECFGFCIFWIGIVNLYYRRIEEQKLGDNCLAGATQALIEKTHTVVTSPKDSAVFPQWQVSCTKPNSPQTRR